MTDRKALIKPEKGETKEQFRERLKAALALGDTSAGGRADAQGEAPVREVTPMAGGSRSDPPDLAEEWRDKILRAFPRGFRVTSERVPPRYIENRAFQVDMEGFNPAVTAFVGPQAPKNFWWVLQSVTENKDGSWDVITPTEPQHWTPMTDEEYGPVTEEWDRFFHERDNWDDF